MKTMMIKIRGVLSFASLSAFVLLIAPMAHADLIGTVGITWLFPDTSSVFASDTIAVGTTLACPGSSPICSGYTTGTIDFTVASTSISYAADAGLTYDAATFNGFDFTGLTFADGGSLMGVTLTGSTIPGLTSSDVSFTGHSVEINLEDLAVSGDFTLNLVEGRAVPEPTYIPVIGVGLASFALLRRRLINR